MNLPTFLNKKLLRASALCLCLSLLACSEDVPVQDQIASPTSPDSDLATESTESKQTSAEVPPKQALRPAFFTAIKSSLEETQKAAHQLEKEVELFVSNPTTEALEKLLSVWEEAHTHYQVMSFLGLSSLPAAPTEADGNSVNHSLSVRLDQYPLIPGYLDSVTGYPKSGIIHTETPITAEYLIHEHQFSDKHYVAIGFHALRFILLGDPQMGIPPETRFIPSQNKTQHTEQVANNLSPTKRRIQYATILSQLIVHDIKAFIGAWQENAHYDQTLRSLSLKEQSLYLIELMEIAAAELKKPSEETHFSADTTSMRSQFLSSLLKQLKAQSDRFPERLQLLADSLEKP